MLCSDLYVLCLVWIEQLGATPTARTANQLYTKDSPTHAHSCICKHCFWPIAGFCRAFTSSFICKYCSEPITGCWCQ